MKKILSLLCVCFLMIGVVACSCKKEKVVKIKIDYEAMPTEADSSSYLYSKFSLLSYELDNAEEYDEKITNQDSFLLFIYRNGCFGCELLSKSLHEYMKNNDIVIYTLSLEKIWQHDLYKVENISDTPYLLLIENGKIVLKEFFGSAQLDGMNKEKNDQFVKDWISKHIIWEE